jgi:hypothetical protein
LKDPTALYVYPVASTHCDRSIEQQAISWVSTKREKEHGLIREINLLEASAQRYKIIKSKASFREKMTNLLDLTEGSNLKAYMKKRIWLDRSMPGRLDQPFSRPGKEHTDASARRSCKYKRDPTKSATRENLKQQQG